MARLHLETVPVLSAITANYPTSSATGRPSCCPDRSSHPSPITPVPARRRHGLSACRQFTLLGSITNLIVAEKAAQAGIGNRFLGVFSCRSPVILLTIVIGSIWLMI
jgi:hypothetical protein